MSENVRSRNEYEQCEKRERVSYGMLCFIKLQNSKEGNKVANRRMESCLFEKDN